MTDEATIDLPLRRAAAARRAGALAEAEALYRRVIEIEPAHDDAVRQYVAVLNELNRFDEAIAVLDATSRADPANSTWPLGRGLVLASQKRHSDAVAAFDTAIGLMSRDPAVHLARGREDTPWYPSARLFRQTAPGDWESAARRVRQALQRFTS
jgi:tetratricopeptide (TPR) repeat protein